MAHALLDASAEAHTLRPEVLSLARLTGGDLVDRTGDITAGETRTASGLALSPSMAALCAEDYVRTVVFVRGAADAVREARSRTDGAVRLLYAGCGPYALLVLPLMAALGPEMVQVTLLDVHAASTASAKQVVERLGLSECVDAIVTADATLYLLDPERLPDVILTETMQVCLEAEPQVAVTRHLLRQAPEALLVPEHIQIDLALVDGSLEFGGGPEREQARAFVGAVFALNAEAVEGWGDAPSPLPAATLALPDDPRQLFLFTTIRTFGAHMLRAHASGLTIPRPLAVDGALPGATVQFEYETGASPGLRARVRLPPRGFLRRVAEIVFGR